MGTVYTLLSIAKILQILLRFYYEPYHMGLTAVCLILDILGSLITISCLRKLHKKVD